MITSCTRWPDIGSGYMIQSDARGLTIITDSLGIWLIPGQILNFNFNDKFILVDQKPYDSICECNSNCYGKISLNQKWSLQRCKEAFKKSNYHQYWIIDKTQPLRCDSTKLIHSNIFGPLSREEFNKILIEVGVPNELKNEFKKKSK